MKKSSAVIMASLMAVSGVSLTSVANEYRTVTWYADHPLELSGVLRICRDNAGLSSHNPNCANADEAQVLVTQREMAQAGGLGSPFSVSYWRQHPSDLRQQLWTCEILEKQHAVMDPATRRICGAARSAGP